MRELEYRETDLVSRLLAGQGMPALRLRCDEGAPLGHTLPGAGQRNAAALSGFKTQEFSGIGYTQLAFDDSNNQLRAQLAVTQHGTQLNLSHLIHQADNHRGSVRGLGFELRTDVYGAIRAGAGVVLSTYGQDLSGPAGDLVPAMALAKPTTKPLLGPRSQSSDSQRTARRVRTWTRRSPLPNRMARAGAASVVERSQCCNQTNSRNGSTT